MDTPRNGPSELGFEEVLAFLHRRWGLLTAAICAGVLAAGAVTLTLRPVYVAQARVRIVDVPSRSGFASFLADVPVGFGDLLGGGQSVATEIEMIRSRPIAASVIDPPGASSSTPDLGLGLLDRVEDLDRIRLWDVYARKFFGREEPQGSLRVEILRWDFGKEFEAPLRIHFEQRDVVRISIDRLFDSHPETARLEPGQSIVYRDAELLLKPEGDLTGRSFLVGRRARQNVIERFLRDLAVQETQRGSKVLAISFPDVDPRRAADIVNAVVRSYLTQNRQRQIEQAARSVEFLKPELERVRGDLQQAEEQLRAFGERAGDIALPETAVALIKELVEVDVEKAKLELGARSKEGLLEQVQEGKFSQQEVAGMEALFFEAYQPKVPLSELIARRSALLTDYTEEWPEVRQLSAEIEGRMSSIESLMKRDISRDQDLAAELEQVGVRYAEKLRELPEAQIELLRHKRSVETYGRIFTLLVGQIEESKVARASAIPTAEVLEWAVPPRLRVAPRLRLNLAVGAFLGLLLGAGFGLFRELARHLRDGRQIEHAFGAPILHVLPLAAGKKHRPLVLRDRPQSALADAYRMLRTAFRHALDDLERPAAVFCGVRSEDGASLTVGNLAVALTGTGKRVLLVDVDPAAGLQAALFGVRGEQGLAQIASGACTWSEAILETSVARLDLLPAGRAGASSADLVASVQAMDWLKAALERYDVVLFDAPPILERSEAGALAAEVGAVVFVCRADQTPERTAIEAAARVHRTGAKVLGVVLYGTRRSGTGEAR